MNKQTIAEILEKSLLNRVRNFLDVLPNYIIKDNVATFVSIFEQISKLTSDIFDEAESLGCRDFFSGWRRLLMPFWKFGEYFECAYGDGFTWNDFLNTVVNENATDVEVVKDAYIPTVYFSYKDNKKFYVALVTED
jgi:hypothetical protein